MHDGIDAGVLREDVVETSLVGHIDLVEGRSLSANELDAIDGFLGRVVEVVDDHDVVASEEEFERREGADVARSSNVVVTLAMRWPQTCARTRTRPGKQCIPSH